jgi:hypothetical protein
MVRRQRPKEKAKAAKAKAKAVPPPVPPPAGVVVEESDEEEDEEDELVEEVEEAAKDGGPAPPPAAAAPKAKRTKAPALTLSNEVQDALVEWVRDNPILYDRNRSDFKLTDKKNQLWAGKAQAMNADDPSLEITGEHQIKALQISLIFNIFYFGDWC